MISNIANRGALFAIIISPQHKEMRSVTVNILYGIPAEHRNMPYDEAIQMIYRNFEQLRQGESGDIIGDNDESPYASIPKSNTRHADSIQHLINLLADNRNLTVLQYDCILKYLQERRETQYKFELGDTSIDTKPTLIEHDNSKSTVTNDFQPTASTTHTEATPTPRIDPEEELQKRLMEILHKPTIPNINVDTSVQEPSAKKSKNDEPTLLNDPKVKNALDSLFNF